MLCFITYEYNDVTKALNDINENYYMIGQGFSYL